MDTNTTVVSRWAGPVIVSGIFVIALLLRLWMLVKLPMLDDEAQLLFELAQISRSYLPVHFVGFGWGENVTLAYLALPLVRYMHIDPLLAIRGVVLLFQTCGYYFLYRLSTRWFTRPIALIAVINAAIWPWSIGASVIGFNAFLLPCMFLGLLLMLEQHRARSENRFIIATGFLGAVMMYTYGAAIAWVPMALLGYWWAFREHVSIRSMVGILACMGFLVLPLGIMHLQSQMQQPIVSHIGNIIIPQLTASRFDFVNVFMLYPSFLGKMGHYVLNYLLHFVTILLIYNPYSVLAANHATLGISLRPLAYVFQLSTGKPFTGIQLLNTTLAYPWDVVFILVGMLTLHNFVIDRGVRRFLYFWLFAWPLAPSLSNGDFLGYTVTRDIFGLPLLMTLSAVGCYAILSRLQHWLKSRPVLSLTPAKRP